MPRRTIEETPLLYDLVPASPLPSFDSTASLRRVLLSQSMERRVLAFGNRYRPSILAAYFCGLIFWAIGFVSPLTTATTWIILLTPGLVVPAVILFTLAMCCDVVRIVMKRFEFWQLIVNLSLWVIFLAISYRDVRVVIVPVLLVNMLNTVMVDAYVFSGKLFTISVLLCLVCIVVLFVEFALDIIHVDSRVVLQLTEKRAITSLDMVQNTTLTVGMLMTRIAIAKIWGFRSDASAVRMIVFRCHLKFESVTSQATATEVRAAEAAGKTGTSRQLRNVPLRALFDPSNTVLPHALRSISSIRRVGLFVIGIIGFVFTVLCAAVDGVNSIYFLVAVAASASFQAAFALFLHRRLLWHIWRSFDYQFLAFQLVSSNVCIAFLTYWNWKFCCNLFCDSMWMLWVLGLDALTPIAREKLHFRLRYAVPVLVFHAVMNVIGLHDLALATNSNLQDRTVFSGKIFGHNVRVSTIAFLANRLMIIVVWCCRLVWRICRRQHTFECIFLSGGVEYTSFPRNSTTTVTPTAT